MAIIGPRILISSPLLLVAFLSIRMQPSAKERQKLHIGGIFPLKAGKGGWAGGEACLPSAQLALDDVKKHESLLPDHELVMTWNDSECMPGLGGKVMYDLLYNEPTKLMLMSGCSAVTTLVAEAAPEWNMIVIGYGSSSPALSNRARFPTLFRTHPSATIHNPTRIYWFDKYSWNKIAIIQTSEEVFESTADDLEEKLRQSGKQLITRVFVSDPADAVRNLARSDARIIVGLFYESVARHIMCEAYKAKLYGGRYVWFLIGWYSENWYLPRAPGDDDAANDDRPIDCTAEQMTAAAERHFTTEAVMLGQENKPTESGITRDEFLNRLRSNLTKPENVTGGFQEAPLAYDAIWAAAKALNCTIDSLKRTHQGIEEFHYGNVKVKNVMLACMKALDFYGISGMVKFSDKGERIMWTQTEQLQNGKYEVVGYYHADTKIFRRDKKVIFENNKVPQDGFKSRVVWKTVSTSIYAAMALFASVGIVTAISLIIFNYKFSDSRFIVHSQPSVNNVMLIGCIVSLVSIFLVGLPTESLEVETAHFSTTCHAKVVLVMAGFSLSFGAMFSKVWYTQKHVGARNQSVPNWKFNAITAGFVIIDLLIATIWIFVDPLRRRVENFEEYLSIDNNFDEIKIHTKMEYCFSEHQYIWIGIIYALKGLLLIIGLFLAYEIRNVKSKHVNDSRFVAMAMYNVVVMSLITGSVSLLIVSQPISAFLLISCTILFCAYISMGIILGHKVIYVIRNRNKAQSRPSKGASESQLTPEERDRLKRLLQENEDIKRQVAEKDTKIAELRRRIEARRSSMATKESSSLGSSSQQQHDVKKFGFRRNVAKNAVVVVKSQQKSVAFGSIKSGGLRIYDLDSGYRSSNDRNDVITQPTVSTVVSSNSEQDVLL